MKRWLGITASAGVVAVIVTLTATYAISAFTLVVAHTQRGLVYKVNGQHARQLIGFVTELEHAYGPIRHLGCYARWGHVALSQHHVGNACDIEQFGWGRTTYRAMYNIGWLARKHGLRDGCSFGDCGHVDAGGPGWVNGGPAGLVAQAELPATATDRPGVGQVASGEWPIPRVTPVKLASTELVPVPHRKHANLQKVRHHHMMAYIWHVVADSDRCVNVGPRMICVERTKVRLRG